MNELNLDFSNEDVDELIASCSESVLNEGLIDIQEENKTPPEAEDDDCQSLPATTFDSERNERSF
jgi:hypothetical protein